MHRRRDSLLTKLSKHTTRLALNIATLGGLVWLGWYAKLLFSHSVSDPLRSSLILIGGLIGWVVFVKLLLKRYRRTWPSFKLTTFLVLCTLVVFTLAGVQPMSTYKDSVIVSYQSWQEVRKKEAAALLVAEKAERRKELSEVVVSMPPTITEALPKTVSTSETAATSEAEKLAFTLINMYREENGVPATLWDDKLYELSKAHTQRMADRGEIFHGSGDVIGENAWGGRGYTHYNSDDLAMEIAASWVNSPLHDAWLLYAPIKESVVSIVVTPDGQYASWTFWTNRLSSGPDLIMKISREYRNSGSNLDWISWLKSKGHL